MAMHGLKSINDPLTLQARPFSGVWLTLLLLALATVSFHNYLLFHTIAEFFSVLISMTFFIIAWHGRRFFDNHYLLFVGISFLFIGVLDLMHTLGFHGMAIFQRQDDSLAPQLWVAARAMEAISLLIAYLFLQRRIHIGWLMTVYTIVTALILLSIFEWDLFPVCWQPGVGLTPFKIYSEYVISGMLILSVFLLHRHKQYFEKKILWLLNIAQLSTVGAELAFTFYVDIYGLSNLVGHILKILASYAIYKAVVETTLETPLKTLYHNISTTRDDLAVANQELQNRQMQLEMAQEIAHLGHWHWIIGPSIPTEATALPGKMTFSSRWLQMFGYQQGEDESAMPSWLELVHPEDVTHVFQSLLDHLHGLNNSYQSEHRIRHQDGHWLWVLERGRVLEWSKEGMPLRMIGACLDITQRRTAEEEIRIFSHAVEQSPSSIIITDTFGVIHYANSRYVATSGYALDEILGKKPNIMKSGITPDHVYQELWQTICRGQVWRGELCNRRKNGELFWELANISPIRRADGVTTHYIGVKYDITHMKNLQEEKQQALERAEQANEAKSQFLANMSHEIRTPLNAIINLSHLLQETQLTAKQSGYLEKVASSGRFLLGMLNDILDFSKIESGHMELEEIPFRLEDVIDNVAGIASSAMEGKNLELLCHWGKGIPALLVGDPMRLGQILANLLNNAIKFTEHGHVLLRMEAVERQETKVVLKFAVQDTGIGISKEQKGRLFQSFSQADGSITRKYGGTGLGLAISSRLVERMGGVIELDSTPGVGSTFFFTLTMGLQPEKRSLPESEISPLQGIRVLVADDHPLAIDILQTMLTQLGTRVVAVTSGTQMIAALELAAIVRDPFKLLLVDEGMPAMSGLETVRRITQMSHLAPLPEMILIACHGRDEVRREAEYLGIKGYIQKPLSPTSLRHTLLRVLAGYASEEVRQGGELIHHSQRNALLAIQGARVLLVEDNLTNQEIAMELLVMAGIQVTPVSGGEEALHILAVEEPFDMVLMDIQMPGLDGYQTTRRLRRNARFANLPVIAMTAHALAGDREKSLAAGMQDHIVKPIDPARLFNALLQWIPPRHSVPLDEKPSEEIINEHWHDLPGIHTKKGLERLAGNHVLYRRLLCRFARERQDVLIDLDKMVQEKNWQDARHLVHNLKGVAGNLGMEKLFQASDSMENALAQQSMAEYEAVLPSLQNHLQEVMKSLAPLLEEEHTLSDKVVLVDKPKIVSVVEEILGMLEEDFAAAQDKLDILRPWLQESEYAPIFRQLCHAVGEFDTDQSRMVLEQLLDQLTTPS
ncbi:MAG: response regulator [Magnetococcales bacterium]|nr:response regulator [Magnetococcales bacterium]NGZ27119.1 response regulator [Magnetococcales bacterium]